MKESSSIKIGGISPVLLSEVWKVFRLSRGGARRAGVAEMEVNHLEGLNKNAPKKRNVIHRKEDRHERNLK
jgi:hypothetical protein